MSEIHYIVRKKFKYGKKWLKPGDEFIPSGGKFDQQILGSLFIARQEGEFPMLTRGRKKVKNAA